MITALYALTLLAFTVYSYALIDPNITFFNNHAWEVFRNVMVQFGYYQRDHSWYVYALLTVLLFVFHYYFVKGKREKQRAFHLALITGIIVVFSYPFLTHDFFNYMFDAKILTFYHQNPYTHAAMDFSRDPWLRFLHWTQRVYPYGPSFLLLTLIPSFLSMGKFIASFFLMKSLFIGSYIVAVWVLEKMNKRWALVLATHPLIIIEGLINGHNDLLALTIGLIGLYYILHKHSSILGRIVILISAAIKYTTLPLIVGGKSKTGNTIAAVGMIFIVGYLSFKSEIQPWYFMTFFVLLPSHEYWLEQVNIFLAGLLFSYYPYIRLGGWDTRDKVELKHTIIIVFLVVNLIWFAARRILGKRSSF